MGKDGWIHYVLLRWCDALQVNLLTHSHGQSFHHIRSTLDETSPSPVSRLIDNDCSVTSRAIIMATKVKGPPQHRCDPIPDTIKTLLQPKTKGVSRQPVRTSFSGTGEESSPRHCTQFLVAITWNNPTLVDQASTLASSMGTCLPRNRQPRSQQTNSKRNEKVIYPENAETPLDEHDTRLDARPLPTHHALLDEISYSTCMSSKRRRDREIPAVGLNACKARTLDARCGKTKCSRGPRGVSWSLNYTSHAEEESR
ncbi:hypothetical protein CK203_113692 [Vitis vinifera]|uniref:Uncharacterized protein n=1 Tax=Vitis vinifera TaxID=29760 RepID=A0A438CCE4_VITVI|nr:hypothetical protein CK203_113692 [Vitis vinifera]